MNGRGYRYDFPIMLHFMYGMQGNHRNKVSKMMTKSFRNTVLMFLVILCVKKFAERLLILCTIKIFSAHVLLCATQNICYSNTFLITEGHWIG